MKKNKKIEATAFILIGGQSKRFGSIKWKEKINGVMILDHIWNCCKNFKSRHIIGKGNFTNDDHDYITDQLIIQSPISGLYTALNHSKTEWNMILSCDLPLLSSSILEKIWGRVDKEFDVIIPYVNNNRQYTCALYNKKCLPIVKSNIDSGLYGMYNIVEQVKSSDIIFKNKIEFLNMNTRKDYEKIKVITK
mgnify:FL=1